MTLRTFNNILSAIVLLLIGWVLLSPIIADATLWWQKHTNTDHGYVYKSAIAPAKINRQLPAIPEDNRLVIPSIYINSKIFEGSSPRTLLKGPWHRPATSTPDHGGNTVIAAHRINYGGTTDFYNLDKVKEGDMLIVYWDHREYDYKVDSITVVSPLDVDVEKDTPDSILTLYTCTPLWTSSKRLVVKGSLVQEGR